MKKINIFVLCLFLINCEQEKIDPNTPKKLDEAVLLFCRGADKEIPSGSHVIVRKKDFKSLNEASKEYVHWKVMQYFTERKNIKTYGNDNVTPQDIKDAGGVFTISIRLEKWESIKSLYRGYFSVEKNGVKAANESVLLKDYAIKPDNTLNALLEKQTDEDSAEPGSEGYDLLIEESYGIGILKIVNLSEAEDDITGVRIYKGNSIIRDEIVHIRHSGGEKEYELNSGDYKLQVKNEFDGKFCTVGAIKITDSKTVTKSYKRCP
jgi:hypothetical protein